LGWQWSAARLGIGFVLPVVAGLLNPARWPAWALAGTVAGELIDRCEFYAELEVPTPERTMARELERRLSRSGLGLQARRASVSSLGF
jgi:hypothetical protein